MIKAMNKSAGGEKWQTFICSGVILKRREFTWETVRIYGNQSRAFESTRWGSKFEALWGTQWILAWNELMELGVVHFFVFASKIIINDINDLMSEFMIVALIYVSALSRFVAFFTRWESTVLAEFWESVHGVRERNGDYWLVGGISSLNGYHS